MISGKLATSRMAASISSHLYLLSHGTQYVMQAGGKLHECGTHVENLAEILRQKDAI